MITIFTIYYGVPIEYHFNSYTNQRRLIIDKIDGIKYNNTPRDQNLAREKLRELEVKFDVKENK